MTSAPCKNCPDRHKSCWDNCKKYKQFKEEKDKENQAMRRDECDVFTIGQVMKVKRKR
ncbi:hypothetical protein [Anaerofustis stercorihominis]|jgi:hypothetical protein|uniref:hypothetical protein n=1 Tax=Anaerofustis stercorihominis TaxID=214853 RepID=UPI0015F32D8C|nr:hypothetical protein [Anaerofustis stercorihominis]